MCVLFALALPLLASSAQTPQYGTGAVVIRDGYPVFTVNGKPFFVWGAAFFYERIPRDRWRASLLALRSLHVNTIDLYVPWNWHEIADGTFDFTGRTNPQRDLAALLHVTRELGFYLVVRPGPVIRNEWRNGGYPAWLLKRPEYGMPLHDVLEGRYPATATLQNARSDDAANAWLHNPTHLAYAGRWLRRSLAQFRPVADRVLAVQLDDDQGAYLTNQTWPARHLREYLNRLAEIVHAATSPRVPVFINTYEMQVPASSPVWTMGNWYQSASAAFADHDRADLTFATQLLATRTQPLMLSEFQAGWLLAPEEIFPRRSDPRGTLLALHAALGEGVRGVIDFPMQDTLSPPGWEAPFANRFYAWDAALRLDGRPSARAEPTAEFGAQIARYGTDLAATHPVYDAAVVWWPSALEKAPLSAGDVTAIADSTLALLRTCRLRELHCGLVDLRFTSESELHRYRGFLVPALPGRLHPSALARNRLAALAKRVPVISSLNDPRATAIVNHRAVRGLAGATLHVGRVSSRTVAFLDAVNLGDTRLHRKLSLDARGVHCTFAVTLEPRSAVLLPACEPQRFEAAPPVPVAAFTQSDRVPIRRDVDAPVAAVGSVVLRNSAVRVVVAPDAGGRAFVFEDLAHHTSAFTTVGALRDDVSIQPPLSATDRIAAWTHTFPAGTFNRSYRVRVLGPRSVMLTYDAPDIVPNGARFEKMLTLPADGRELLVRERLVPLHEQSPQRLVVRSSIALGDTASPSWRPPLVLARAPLALYDTQTHELVIVRWPRHAVETSRLEMLDRHAVLRLQYAPGWHTTAYEYRYVAGIAEARARLRAAAREGR